MSNPRDIVHRLQVAADWHEENGRPFSAAEDLDAMAEIQNLRVLLRWLDRRGGLGLEVHERIRAALGEVTPT
jgi:hypothetical protein